MDSRRTTLKEVSVEQVAHAGLWLDRYVRNLSPQATIDVAPRRKEPAKTVLVREASQVAVLAERGPYQQFFNRWLASLQETGARCWTASTTSRLAVGLGGGSVLETAVTLQRTYGLPMIPGSALKGLAAHLARTYLAPQDPHWAPGGSLTPAADTLEWSAYDELFGSHQLAGSVTFFDALYIPGSGLRTPDNEPCALWPDIMAIHHPDYYQNKPLDGHMDSDSPIMVPFLSATGSYLLALAGKDSWVQVAQTMLAQALPTIGIGAKTSSGYGRLSISGLYDPAPHVVKPPPIDPPVPTYQIGEQVTGQMIRHDARTVEVKINRVPAGMKVEAILSAAAARQSGRYTRGGIRAIIIARREERGRLYLTLEPLT